LGPREDLIASASVTAAIMFALWASLPVVLEVPSFNTNTGKLCAIIASSKFTKTNFLKKTESTSIYCFLSRKCFYIHGKNSKSSMVKEELRYASLATLILGIIDTYLLLKRILGSPLFQPTFEFMIFYFPLSLLVIYLIYLKNRYNQA
jgi:hypothetical protein